jgi:hypothetical protein
MVLSSWSKAYGVSMDSLVDREVERIVAGVNATCIDDLADKLSVLTAEISQGADDKLVRSSVTSQFVRRLCRSGTSVIYNVVKEADHDNIAPPQRCIRNCLDR